MDFSPCADCGTVWPSDIQQAIWVVIIFAAPIGALVMHRHYRTATGWLRWMIIALRVLAVVSAPFVLLTLYSAALHAGS
jgi:hypothetical protein